MFYKLVFLFKLLYVLFFTLFINLLQLILNRLEENFFCNHMIRHCYPYLKNSYWNPIFHRKFSYQLETFVRIRSMIRVRNTCVWRNSPKCSTSGDPVWIFTICLVSSVFFLDGSFTTARISQNHKLVRKKFGHPTARVLWTSSAFLHVFGPSVLCSRTARVKQPRILCEGAARISSTHITTHFFPRLMSVRLEKPFTALSVFITTSKFFFTLWSA